MNLDMIFGAFIHTLCGTLRFVAQRWDRLTTQSMLGMLVHELDTDFWCNGTHTMCVACILDKVWNALGHIDYAKHIRNDCA